MQFQIWTFKLMKDRKFAQLNPLTILFLLIISQVLNPTFHSYSFICVFLLTLQHALLWLVMFLQIIFNDLSSLESANSDHRLRPKQEKAP